MNAHMCRSLGVGFLSLVVVGPLYAQSQRSDLDSNAASTVKKSSVDRSVPERSEVGAANPGLLEFYSLPYSGFGTVWLLENGMLIIDVGGEAVVDEEGETKIASSVETIGFQIDTAGVSLVSHRGDYLLDRQGRHVRQRGWEGKQLTVTQLDAGVDEDRDLHSLMEISGKLDVAFDRETKTLLVEVADVLRGHRFSVQALVNFSASQGDVAPVGRTLDDGFVQLVPAVAWTASCDTTCTGGNCDITCVKKMAQCWCGTDGTSICRCIAVPQ